MASKVAELYAEVRLDEKSLDKDIDGLQGKLTGRLKSIGNLAGSALSLGLTGGIAALGAAGGALKMFAEGEEQGAKLEAVLKATGHAAGFSGEQLQQYATDLQKVTTFEDDATVGAMAVAATFRNIKGDNFKEAIALAQDMSTVLGGDLNSSVMQVSKALNDPVAGLTALGRAGVTFSESQKATIKSMVEMGDVAGAQKVILAELRGEFGGAAQAAAKTTAGTFAQLKNEAGSLAESVGGLLAPAFGKFIEWAKESVATLQWGVDNYDLLWKLAGEHVKLFAENSWERIKTFFANIPVVAQWAIDNWRELLTDFASFHQTVIENIGSNLYNFFAQVVKWLKGDGFDFEWTGLTDGFKSSIKGMPKLIQAELKTVTPEMQRILDELGQRDREKNKPKREPAEEEGPGLDVENMGRWLKPTMIEKAVGGAAGGIAGLANAVAGGFLKAANFVAEIPGGKAIKEQQQVQQFGLADFASHLQTSLGGKKDDIQKQIAAENRQWAGDMVKELIGAIKKIDTTTSYAG